jgi:hypothetical protein
MAKPISWKDWTLVILIGFLCAGNIAGGTPFVIPNSAEAVGRDLFSSALWCVFFWSLSPFLRIVFGKKNPKEKVGA